MRVSTLVNSRNLWSPSLANQLLTLLGEFALQALSSEADLIESTVRDPLNDGRTRIVTFTTPNATSYLSGSVSWQGLDTTLRDVQPPPDAGTLQGRTVSAKVLLQLGNLELFADPTEWPSGCVVP